MQWAAEATAHNTGTTLTLALNYGARSEIVDAVRRILTDSPPKPTPRLLRRRHPRRRRARARRVHIQRASLHRAHARPRPPHPHLRRAAHLQLSFSGRSPTRRSSSPTASGPTSAASISSKPSRTTSAASAASAASATAPNPTTSRRCPPIKPPWCHNTKSGANSRSAPH